MPCVMWSCGVHRCQCVMLDSCLHNNRFYCFFRKVWTVIFCRILRLSAHVWTFIYNSVETPHQHNTIMSYFLSVSQVSALILCTHKISVCWLNCEAPQVVLTHQQIMLLLFLCSGRRCDFITPETNMVSQFFPMKTVIWDIFFAVKYPKERQKRWWPTLILMTFLPLFTDVVSSLWVGSRPHIVHSAFITHRSWMALLGWSE